MNDDPASARGPQRSADPLPGGGTPSPQTGPPARHWVIDTSSLWGITQAGLLGVLLDQLRGRLHLTPAVRDDLTRNVGANPFLQEALDAIASGAIDEVALSPQELARTFDLHSTLWQHAARDTNDLGEAETVAVASYRGWHVFMDDGDGRRAMMIRWSHLECALTAEVLLAFVDGGILTMTTAWEALVVMGDAVTERPRWEWNARRNLRIIRL